MYQVWLFWIFCLDSQWISLFWFPGLSICPKLGTSSKFIKRSQKIILKIREASTAHTTRNGQIHEKFKTVICLFTTSIWTHHSPVDFTIEAWQNRDKKFAAKIKKESNAWKVKIPGTCDNFLTKYKWMIKEQSRKSNFSIIN